MINRQIKERPVLFNGGMVRAILFGRKTQTRRVVKHKGISMHRQSGGAAVVSWCDKPGEGITMSLPGFLRTCPYGQPGDRLWVRETWAIARGSMNPECEIDQLNGIPKAKPEGWGIAYRSTAPTVPVSWTPSIHMPRWASRIDLLITGVRVERLQDISEADAIAEGVRWPSYEDFIPIEVNGFISGPARIAFNELWDSINAKRGYGWSVNPWVWVVEFERA